MIPNDQFSAQKIRVFIITISKSAHDLLTIQIRCRGLSLTREKMHLKQTDCGRREMSSANRNALAAGELYLSPSLSSETKKVPNMPSLLFQVRNTNIAASLVDHANWDLVR